MLQEPVAIQITRGTLEAIASRHPRWKNPESVWEGFRKWSLKRGIKTALAFQDRPPFFHDLLSLYEFGIETCRDMPQEEFMKLTGRCFARILLRERLPDLLEVCIKWADDLPLAVERLFYLFMDTYSGGLYRITSERANDRVAFQLDYMDREGVERHLKPHGKDPQESFFRSVTAIIAISEACLEYIVAGWRPEHLKSSAREGSFEVSLPSNVSFHYKKLLETLTQYTHQVQERHAKELATRDLEHDLTLQSPLMREKWNKIKLASATDEIILLRGEPGTGKTHLAARIHEMSARQAGPFVEVGLTSDIGEQNLIQSHLFGYVKGAFTSATEDRPGLFAVAQRGTIFLDEIGDASPELQSRLLRVIEKKTFKPLGSTRDVTVDVRIITATNRNLEARVSKGTFRQDLYDRLKVIQFEMPPLRSRQEELPLLCEHFLRQSALELKKPNKELDPGVLDFAGRYGWPGNFRELINVLKYGLLFSEGDRITMADLPEDLTKAKVPPLRTTGSSSHLPRGTTLIDVERLGRLLKENEDAAIPKGRSSEIPWHVDYAKKAYLKALILHFGGNLRKITRYWDRDSERALRSLVKKYGLWEDLERARLRR